ncbi:MAG TPA: WG repeat-containing protein, partial [Firmicutes bacterium]|nr:WG repeat-containing protein [Bacillota bacterium]
MRRGYPLYFIVRRHIRADTTLPRSSRMIPIELRTGDLRMARWILVFSAVIALAACSGDKGTTEGEVRGGLYPMATMAGYGFIDSTGRVVIEPQFMQVTDEWVDGLMSVSIGELYGLVDTSGRIVLPPTQIRQVFPEISFRNGLARAETDTGIGFINRRGDFVIPARFSNTYGFNEGVAPVRDMEKRWGYIDTTGAWVIEPQFDDVTPFTDGLAVFQKDRKWG